MGNTKSSRPRRCNLVTKISTRSSPQVPDRSHLIATTDSMANDKKKYFSREIDLHRNTTDVHQLRRASTKRTPPTPRRNPQQNLHLRVRRRNRATRAHRAARLRSAAQPARRAQTQFARPVLLLQAIAR